MVFIMDPKVIYARWHVVDNYNWFHLLVLKMMMKACRDLFSEILLVKTYENA